MLLWVTVCSECSRVMLFKITIATKSINIGFNRKVNTHFIPNGDGGRSRRRFETAAEEQEEGEKDTMHYGVPISHPASLWGGRHSPISPLPPMHPHPPSPTPPIVLGETPFPHHNNKAALTRYDAKLTRQNPLMNTLHTNNPSAQIH